MATGLGIQPAADGTGTTPEDIQRIIGAEWRVEGIISGCAVEGSSKMEYHVFAGAVVLNWGTDMKLKVPVPDTRVPADTNPGTSTRRDKVYVQQHTVEADGDNVAVVAVTQGSLPPRSVLLADYEVSAGATDTKSATDRSNRVYSRPVGGQFGQIAKHIYTDTTDRGKELVTCAVQPLRFAAMWNGVAPTDRDVTVNFTSCISSGAGLAADAEGSVIYRFYLNDSLVYSVERVFNKYWESKHFSFPLVIQQPDNTIKYTMQWKSGAAKYAVRFGGADKYPGQSLVVVDNGVANL